MNDSDLRNSELVELKPGRHLKCAKLEYKGNKIEPNWDHQQTNVKYFHMLSAMFLSIYTHTQFMQLNTVVVLLLLCQVSHHTHSRSNLPKHFRTKLG